MFIALRVGDFPVSPFMGAMHVAPAELDDYSSLVSIDISPLRGCSYDQSRLFTPRLSFHGSCCASLAWRFATGEGGRRSNQFQKSELRTSICFVSDRTSVAVPDNSRGPRYRRVVPTRISCRWHRPLPRQHHQQDRALSNSRRVLNAWRSFIRRKQLPRRAHFDQTSGEQDGLRYGSPRFQ